MKDEKVAGILDPADKQKIELLTRQFEMFQLCCDLGFWLIVKFQQSMYQVLFELSIKMSTSPPMYHCIKVSRVRMHLRTLLPHLTQKYIKI